MLRLVRRAPTVGADAELCMPVGLREPTRAGDASDGLCWALAPDRRLARRPDGAPLTLRRRDRFPSLAHAVPQHPTRTQAARHHRLLARRLPTPRRDPRTFGLLELGDVALACRCVRAGRKSTTVAVQVVTTRRKPVGKSGGASPEQFLCFSRAKLHLHLLQHLGSCPCHPSSARSAALLGLTGSGLCPKRGCIASCSSRLPTRQRSQRSHASPPQAFRCRYQAQRESVDTLLMMTRSEAPNRGPSMPTGGG